MVCLIEAGRLEEATRAAQAARREFPGSAYFDFCLARIAARSGRKGEAAALLRAALERDPSARQWIASVRDFEALRTEPGLKTLLEPGR